MGWPFVTVKSLFYFVTKSKHFVHPSTLYWLSCCFVLFVAHSLRTTIQNMFCYHIQNCSRLAWYFGVVFLLFCLFIHSFVSYLYSFWYRDYGRFYSVRMFLNVCVWVCIAALAYTLFAFDPWVPLPFMYQRTLCTGETEMLCHGMACHRPQCSTLQCVVMVTMRPNSGCNLGKWTP